MVMLNPQPFSDLIADGRHWVPQDFIHGAGRATRAHEVVFAGQVMNDVSVGGLDADLSLTTELGHRVDGVLGVDFLAAFVVELDYPHGLLRLFRYDAEDHLIDPYHRLGFTLRPDDVSHRYVVHSIDPNTDADQVLVPGYVVLAIDDLILET